MNEKMQKFNDKEPILKDSIAIQLASSIRVAEDHIEFRKNRQSSRWFWDAWWGDSAEHPSERQVEIDENLLEGQKKLFELFNQLFETHLLTKFALNVTQNKLLETREAVRTLGDVTQKMQSRIEELESALRDAVDQIDRRLNRLEEQVQQLTVSDIVTRRTDAWRAGRLYQTYTWFTQAMLIIMDTLHHLGPARISVLNERSEIKQQLANRIIEELNERDIDTKIPLKRLFRKQIKELEKSQKDKLLAAFEPRRPALDPGLDFPLEFTFGTALELDSASIDANQVGDNALNIAEQFDAVPRRVYSLEQLIDEMIEERVNICRTLSLQSKSVKEQTNED